MPDAFASCLLAWWDEHGRKNLPWQRQRTSYRVWVSEIMLQQTRASAVVPYFKRFMARFPTVEALAGGSRDEVLHLWSGLGYYARARNLHRAARIVVRDHGGNFPDALADILALPGIGRSTAAAIVAQAYNRRAAILDGNVKRVLARQHRVAGPVSSTVTVKALWALAETHTPAHRAADYTQAIMDLGAMLCLRRQPGCVSCPVRATCQAFAAGEVERFPEPAARRARRLQRRRFFVLTDPDGACFVEQRPATGVWGGLWSPPERDSGDTADGFLAWAGIDAALVEAVHVAPVFRHGFSHYDLDVEPIYLRLGARPPAVRDGSGAWILPGRHRLGISAVAAKLLAGTEGELFREP